MSTAKWRAGRRPPPSRRGPQGSGASGDGETVAIYGLHAAAAALANPRRTIRAAHASENAAERLGEALGERGLKPAIEPADRLARLAGDGAVHQGIVLEAMPLAPVALSEIAPAGPLLALDQVTDPRNLGAILRVAAAFAAAGLIVTRRHRPAESGLIAKAASGGLEHVPLIEVTNLARALDEAGDSGYWIAGLDSEGVEEFSAIAGHRPLLIVLGSEGEGLRRLTRAGCDGLYRIALPGPVRSLNVATAAAIALQIAATAKSG